MPLATRTASRRRRRWDFALDLPDDRTFILEVLFDIRSGVRDVIELLEDDDEEEKEEADG